MQIQMYLLNKTYIAEDRSTGLVVYAKTPEQAEEKLHKVVEEYWEKRKVVVPINIDPPKKSRLDK